MFVDSALGAAPCCPIRYARPIIGLPMACAEGHSLSGTGPQDHARYRPCLTPSSKHTALFAIPISVSIAAARAKRDHATTHNRWCTAAVEKIYKTKGPMRHSVLKSIDSKKFSKSGSILAS